MTLTRFFFLLSALGSCTLPAGALQVNTKAIANKQIYGIEFPGNARAYFGRERVIQSISKQEYVTATFRVVEVNIVTAGPALLRIYHSRSLKAEEITGALGKAGAAGGTPGASIIQTELPPNLKGLAGRANTMADTITDTEVFKDYPIATHAHTIEFRVSSLNELLELYDELKKHWLKEPTYFEDGQIVEEGSSTTAELKPRTLGGTLFTVEN